MYSLDLSILQMYNQLAGRSHAFDLLVTVFTDYSPFLFAVLFLVYFVRRTPQREAMRRTILLSGIAGVLALTVTALIAAVFYRARPFTVLPPDQIHLIIPHAADSSFPSDHTMGSAAFAAGMWRAPGRSARWVFLVTALLVGLSRLIAGVHWPSDVAGSFILGAAVAAGTFALKGLFAPVLDWVLMRYRRIEAR